MSRIGKKPIPLPKGVEVNITGNHIAVKGPKGTLERNLPPEVIVTKEKDHIICSVKDNTDKRVKSLHGLVRSLVANMVTGVEKGFTKELEVVGVAYKIKQEGKKLILNMGYSHPVIVEPPSDVTLKVDGTKIIVSGANKEIVGQVAADIRKVKPPEVYKGTGIRYVGEKVRIKEGKKLAA